MLCMQVWADGEADQSVIVEVVVSGSMQRAHGAASFVITLGVVRTLGLLYAQSGC